MKKLILSFILSVFLILPLFSSSPKEISKAIEKFLDSGTYIKIELTASGGIKYIRKDLISSIHFTTYTPILSYQTAGNEKGETIYLQNYDVSNDSKGNLLVTYKE